MVLSVTPTPTRSTTNSLYTPMDSTPLHSISSVCHPWGVSVVAVPSTAPKKSAWLPHLIGDKAPPATRDTYEVAHTYGRHSFNWQYNMEQGAYT